MGLLSNASLTPHNKIAKILTKYHSKLCWLCYVASIVWFCCLAHNDFNYSTYLSENALSPGLVYPEITQDSSRLMQQYLSELEKQREVHKTSTPYDWVHTKMQQIGLEVYSHNYTLKYPFADNKRFTGKNIYGILRAPRASSTEGIVFSVPYRPPSSVHVSITASIPILLTFAEFARKRNYWAKDLIFLVTEHEQLGIHAFLEAYFGPSNNGNNEYLNYGYLPARAGALQAALNLEIQDLHMDCIDIKIEGLNGQLPNLDLFNVVQRIALRESIPSGYKQATLKNFRSYKSSYENNLKHMISMLLSQATGIPNGNHGHFHRHRIEALTIEGIRRKTNKNNHHNHASGGLALLRIIEGTSRSLNNLLERFHQSYFFYILIQNDRFVSIGNYMPCLVWLILPLCSKAYLLWLMANDDKQHKNNENPENENDTDVETEDLTEVTNNTSDHSCDQNEQLPLDPDVSNLHITPAIVVIVFTSLVGAMCRYPLCVDFFIKFVTSKGMEPPLATTIMISFWSLVGCVQPLIYRLPQESLYWLHFFLLLSVATTLSVIGLLNFALAYIIAIFLVPLALTVNSLEDNTSQRIFSILHCLVLHPLSFIFITVSIFTLLQFPELSPKHLIYRAITATMDGITFSMVDDLIYGNWLYTMVTCLLLPLWCGYWTLAVSQYYPHNNLITTTSKEKKTN